MSVDQLARSLATGECTPVDVNTSAVRKRQGKIPGAILLSYFKDYAIDELPADKNRQLVFYCSNHYCGASEAAARQAEDAGYRHVSVMREGISGWAKAGHPTEAVP